MQHDGFTVLPAAADRQLRAVDGYLICASGGVASDRVCSNPLLFLVVIAQLQIMEGERRLIDDPGRHLYLARRRRRIHPKYRLQCEQITTGIAVEINTFPVNLVNRIDKGRGHRIQLTLRRLKRLLPKTDQTADAAAGQTRNAGRLAVGIQHNVDLARRRIAKRSTEATRHTAFDHQPAATAITNAHIDFAVGAGRDMNTSQL